MSEPITKDCIWNGCNGTGYGDSAYDGEGPHPKPCPNCSGTGRVPDVEATLRAEVARLTEELDLTTRALNLHEIELRRACEEIVNLKSDLRVMDELLVQKDKRDR